MQVQAANSGKNMIQQVVKTKENKEGYHNPNFQTKYNKQQRFHEIRKYPS